MAIRDYPVSVILLLLHLLTTGFKCQSEPNNFDQILNELNILTQRQLQPSSTTTPRVPVLSSPVPSPSKGKLNSTGSNHRAFRLPPRYDPNQLPKYSRVRPLAVGVNMTVLHVTLDKNENIITLDLEMRECWKDKRLKIRKSSEKNSEDEELQDDEEEEDSVEGRKVESFVLESEWASRIWHPLSRLLANAEVSNPYTIEGKQSKQNRMLEQQSLIENIYIVSNESTGFVWLSLKLRLTIPSYECERDDSSLYPFDRIKCFFNIANALYDRKSLIYKWENINWKHNGYHNGEFYMQTLQHSIRDEPILELDKAYSEHSTMRIEFQLRRQIGDYILNVYLLHIFLLALCVASFWLSITNIVIRMSLSIIILIIIKFQTIQTLKDERHLFSALSVWTFGLSCLVILSLLCHILSYYSSQHKWNEKILNRLIEGKRNRHRSGVDRSGTVAGDSGGANAYDMSEANGDCGQPVPPTPPDTGIRFTLANRWAKIQQNCLQWLNSIIVRKSRKPDVGFDSINLVDILARFFLPVIYILFILIYFCKYVF